MSNVLPGTNIPKLDLIRSNPEAAATISKAIRPQVRNGFDVNKKETYYSLNQSKIQAISDVQKSRLRENENILDLFPDIQLAEQIIVSSILAPKDMFTENLIYQTISTLLPSHIQTKINDVIKHHIETYYDLQGELPQILKEAIFRSGSYVSAVIPEAAVDEIINGRNYATESDRSLIRELIDDKGQSVSIGILGPSTHQSSTATLENFFNSKAPSFNTNTAVSLESHKDWFVSKDTSGFLEITDNFQLIKLPKLMESISKQRLNRAIKNPIYSSHQRTSLESYDGGTVVDPKKLTTTEFANLVYKNGKAKQEVFSIIPSKISQKRYSIGRPLRLKIPSEAIVPVFPPGDPSNHRGYFVLVDAEGNWVTRSSVDTTNSGLQSLLSSQNSNNSLTSLMIQKAKTAMKDSQNTIMIDNMLEIYSSIVENDMLARLKNGIYGTQLTIGKDKEWDRIMLARALAGKMTRTIYIPAEIITYYAYDYHPNGIGKSYLDQVKMLTSLRAVLLFSKVMAELKNAINVTKVDMTIDPEDPDPQKTIEMASHDVIRLREAYFPLGVNSPVDLMEWIQRAGLMFTFKGHPGLPETSFEFSQASMDHKVPDSDTQDDLRKQTFQTFGLTPEQIDQGFGPDFATTAIMQNALFAKRILLLSNKTALHMTTDVRNICTNDAIILKEISDILKEAKDDLTKYLDEKEKDFYAKSPDVFIHQFLDKVIENIWIDLPKPDVSSKTVKAQVFNDYSEMLDKVLTSYFSSEVFTSQLNGEMASHVDEIKNFWKHYFLRNWVAEEGYLPQIADVFKRDENGNPANDVLEIMEKYTKDVMLSAMKYIEKANVIKQATDADIANLNVETGSPSSSESSSSETGSEESGGGIFDTGDLGGEGELEEGPGNEEGSETSETNEENKEEGDQLGSLREY